MNFKFPKLKSSYDYKLILTIILWVLVSRITIYLIAYAGYLLFENKSLNFYESFKVLWQRWDAIHYIHIAENWYTNSGEDRFLIVYFPFYPLLIRMLKFLIKDHCFSGLFISNLSLFFSGYYLFKLTAIDYGEKTAWRALRYLLIFPFSFFLVTTYSDSLFLALSLATVYYLRKQKWFLVGIFGFMASMTRNFGVLLIVPALIECCQFMNLTWKTKNKLLNILKEFWNKWIFLFLIPAGTVVYLLINWWITGSIFTFLTYQHEHWHQGFGFIWNNLYSMMHNILTWELTGRVSFLIPQFILFWFSIFLFFYSIKKIRLSYLFYFIIYLFLVFSPSWLLSGSRYLIGAFPIYIALGHLSDNQTIDFIISFIMLLFLTFFVLAFTRGFYVM